MSRQHALEALGWSLLIAFWIALSVLVVMNWQGRYPFHPATTGIPTETCSVNQSTGDVVCDTE